MVHQLRGCGGGGGGGSKIMRKIYADLHGVFGIFLRGRSEKNLGYIRMAEAPMGVKRKLKSDEQK